MGYIVEVALIVYGIGVLVFLVWLSVRDPELGPMQTLVTACSWPMLVAFVIVAVLLRR